MYRSAPDITPKEIKTNSVHFSFKLGKIRRDKWIQISQEVLAMVDHKILNIEIRDIKGQMRLLKAFLIEVKKSPRAFGGELLCTDLKRKIRIVKQNNC